MNQLQPEWLYLIDLAPNKMDVTQRFINKAVQAARSFKYDNDDVILHHDFCIHEKTDREMYEYVLLNADHDINYDDYDELEDYDTLTRDNYAIEEDKQAKCLYFEVKVVVYEDMSRQAMDDRVLYFLNTLAVQWMKQEPPKKIQITLKPRPMIMCN